MPVADVRAPLRDQQLRCRRRRENADVKPGLLVGRSPRRSTTSALPPPPGFVCRREARPRRAARVVQTREGTDVRCAPWIAPAEARRGTGRRPSRSPPCAAGALWVVGATDLRAASRAACADRSRRVRDAADRPPARPPSAAAQRTREARAAGGCRCWRLRRHSIRRSGRADARRALLAASGSRASARARLLGSPHVPSHHRVAKCACTRMPGRRRYPYGDARDAPSSALRSSPTPEPADASPVAGPIRLAQPAERAVERDLDGVRLQLEQLGDLLRAERSAP